MGIQTEFNPDLALRNINEFKEGKRLKEECIPENIINGQIYEFLKKGQRLFWLSEDEKWNKGELPLYETKGQGKFSRPLASIKILEVTHFIKNQEIWTKGKYKIIDVFNTNERKINFEGCKRIK